MKKCMIPVGMMKLNSIISLRRHPKRRENPKKKRKELDTIGLSCRSKDVLGEFDY